MATYKVIQDIEAEDKFIGPLTLKQFIFGATAVLFGYLNVFALTRGATWALAIFVPPMALGAFLAIPWSKDQSTEVWVLAKIRFRFKPRQRIWNQAGVQELVTITVPKKVEKILTNNLTQTEVTSRLQALAETIDSRGWAIKNSALQTQVAPAYNSASDRLLSPTVLPQTVPELDMASIPDIMDEDSGAVSANFDAMIQAKDVERKEQMLEKMQRIRTGESLESANQPPVNFRPPTEHVIAPPTRQSFIPPAPAPATPPTIDERLLTEELRTRSHVGDIAYQHMHTLSTSPAPATPTPPAQSPASTDDQTDIVTDKKKAQAAMTGKTSPDILGLARNNDLNVATIARQANRPKHDDNEVVISLR